MATTTNPFEPPRTTDLDGDAPVLPGPRVVPAEAVRELAAAAGWVRGLARLTAVSIAVQVLRLIVESGRARGAGTMAVVVVSYGVTIAMAILFLIRLNRYAATSERVWDGDVDAVGSVIDAQASYLKLASVLVGIGAGVFVFALALAIGSGRFFSWIYR